MKSTAESMQEVEAKKRQLEEHVSNVDLKVVKIFPHLIIHEVTKHKSSNFIWLSFRLTL